MQNKSFTYHENKIIFLTFGAFLLFWIKMLKFKNGQKYKKKTQYLIYRININIHDVVIFICDRTVELGGKKKKL